jgi:hypothetical protein
MNLAPPRPRSVTMASWLLLACAVVGAIDCAIAGLGLHHLGTATNELLALNFGSGQQIEDELSQLRGDLWYDTSLAAASGILLAVLGVAIRRPSRVARTIAWFVCLGLSISLVVGLTASPENVMTVNPSDPAPLRHALDNLLFPWYPAVQSAIAGLEIILLVVVLVRLSQATSGDYYRKLRADVAPSTWGALGDPSSR